MKGKTDRVLPSLDGCRPALSVLVGRLELKSKLPSYLALALKEVHTEARDDSAWKRLLAGNHMELLNEAKALNDEGRLFDSVPTAPRKTAEAVDLILSGANDSSLDESGEEGADDEMLVEQDEEVLAPAWEVPLEITCVAEAGAASWSSSSSAPAVIDPGTVVPPTRVGQMSRFLALRLVTGTATQRDLDKVAARTNDRGRQKPQPPTKAGGNICTRLDEALGNQGDVLTKKSLMPSSVGRSQEGDDKPRKKEATNLVFVFRRFWSLENELLH